MNARTGWLGITLAVLGALTSVVTLWMVFFWVPTERTMGVIQRIFYIHVPSAWVAFLAFGIVAVASGVYLWLGDERADMAARAAAEGGLLFTVIVLTTGPLWGKIAWGTYWTWEPRLTLTLILGFIYVGYMMVRNAAASPEQGKRFAAVVGIVGALFIPLIHMSVYWFRGLHPDPVILNPEGPTADWEIQATLYVGLLAFTLLFLGLMTLRYGVERARHILELREAA